MFMMEIKSCCVLLKYFILILSKAWLWAPEQCLDVSSLRIQPCFACVESLKICLLGTHANWKPGTMICATFLCQSLWASSMLHSSLFIIPVALYLVPEMQRKNALPDLKGEGCQFHFPGKRWYEIDKFLSGTVTFSLLPFSHTPICYFHVMQSQITVIYSPPQKKK